MNNKLEIPILGISISFVKVPKLIYIIIVKEKKLLSSSIKAKRKNEDIMSNKYLANSFSLQMIGEEFPLIESHHILVDKVSIEDIDTDGLVSVIGHQDTANILSSILGTEIVPNRTNVKLSYDDILYVAQYTGPRLPEGAIFTFYKVKIGKPITVDFGATAWA